MSELSPAAKKALKMLNEKQKEAIQKDNPFRNDRDQAVREMKKKGLTLPVLAEITGISRNQVFAIVNRKTKSSKNAPDSTSGTVDSLMAAFEAFLHEKLQMVLEKIGKEKGRQDLDKDQADKGSP